MQYNMMPPQNVPDSQYHRDVWRRRARCQDIMDRYASIDRTDVVMIVLSCKRPVELKRLINSLLEFRRKVGVWALPSRRVLVDNGSGDALLEMARQSGIFTHTLPLERNFGMGAAINEALKTFPCEFVLFVEDDLILEADKSFIAECLDIFKYQPEVGIIKLKHKDRWDTMYPYRRIGPRQVTPSGVAFDPWLPSPRWTFQWGQRPWYPAGIHNCWSLGPVMFRWCSWAENGPIPSGQGRMQAWNAEQGYARTWNTKWLAARPVDIRPFSQPVTQESPGFSDVI